jgi:hypothetical protein
MAGLAASLFYARLVSANVRAAGATLLFIISHLLVRPMNESPNRRKTKLTLMSRIDRKLASVRFLTF